jgi:hypothetical protein
MMPNAENINKLISVLKGLPDEKFNISEWYTDIRYGSRKYTYEHCNTAACVAGWAAAVKHDFKPVEITASMEYEVAEWLGVGPYDSNRLFRPFGYTSHPERFTRQKAIETLERLRDTGEVDWKVMRS